MKLFIRIKMTSFAARCLEWGHGKDEFLFLSDQMREMIFLIISDFSFDSSHTSKILFSEQSMWH